jgi:hypothetical protein
LFVSAFCLGLLTHIAEGDWQLCDASQPTIMSIQASTAPARSEI